jgi:hypothetical protein
MTIEEMDAVPQPTLSPVVEKTVCALVGIAFYVLIL